MKHVLDNMIWQAITTGNKDIAMVEGPVGFYDADVAPFAALQERTNENMNRLHALLPEGRRVALSYFDPINPDKRKWELLQQMDCCQMVYEKQVTSFTTEKSSAIVPLNETHVPQMLELTALTRPGPFLQNTIRFGNYFGIFENDRLAAMTGQRMHATPYLEVSAVCTHPDFRGRGFAKALMLHVMKLIIDQDRIPFLHVLAANTGAIHLYETIGYRTRTRIGIDVLKRL